MKELDHLFRKIYEDNVNGKLHDERFYNLSDGAHQTSNRLNIGVAGENLCSCPYTFNFILFWYQSSGTLFRAGKFRHNLRECKAFFEVPENSAAVKEECEALFEEPENSATI